MKVQINITDEEKDGKSVVIVKTGTAKSGFRDDGPSSAVRLGSTLYMVARLLNHPSLSEPLGATLAAYDTLAAKMAEVGKSNELEEDITE